MTGNEQKRSRREEAEYWESHTLDEVASEEQGDEAVVVRKPLSSVFSIRLDPEAVKQLRDMASAMGVGPTTMARMLILQGLRDPYPSPPQIVRMASIFPTTLPQGEGEPDLAIFQEMGDNVCNVIGFMCKQQVDLVAQLKQLKGS